MDLAQLGSDSEEQCVEILISSIKIQPKKKSQQLLKLMNFALAEKYSQAILLKT